MNDHYYYNAGYAKAEKEVTGKFQKQIEWLVDELAYELVQNETQAACPADPEAIERKRLAIITDMQEIE